MAYSEALAQRTRRVLAIEKGVAEQAMFGGLAFMLEGKMCCGIVGDQLVVRVGPERYEEALAEPHTRPMDFTGRPLRGMVYVKPAGYRTAGALRKWVYQGIQFASTLRAKRRRRPTPIR